MRKKLALLLAGTVTLSILLSACSVQMDDAVHTYTLEGAWTEAPSAAPVETAAAAPESDVPSAPAEASAPPTEPAGESSPDAASTDTPAASAAPAVVSAPKPAVSAPKPAVGTPAPAVNPPAPASDAPRAPDTPPPAAETLAPAPEPTPEPAPAVTKSDAQAFIGRSASSLIAAIGQPLSRSYAPSCLGDGEDGELIYSGFTVYTYREGDTETVLDVM